MAHLLLVDDEDEIINALKRSLQSEYTITSCTDSCFALDTLKHSDVDIVLSDIKMPKLDGFELLKKVKEHNPQIGRVLMSGYADIETCEHAVEEGIASFIIMKPWDNFELHNVLRLVLKVSQLTAENQKLMKDISDLTSE